MPFLHRVHRRATTMLILSAALEATPVFAACTADSGLQRASLVELYTSEGCSSCPPADRKLAALAKGGPTVVPLALHVDYWDSIGWKDPFAQPAFARRQEWEVRANARRTSYTPHFFVDGREVLDWRADLDDNLRPSRGEAKARIRIDASADGAGALRIRADASVAGSGGSRQLFVVVTESALGSQVDAGENRGVRLEHDAVARNWIGPIPVQAGSARLDRSVPVPQLPRGHVAVVAFVQDAVTAEVLQAVGTGACQPT